MSNDATCLHSHYESWNTRCLENSISKHRGKNVVWNAYPLRDLTLHAGGSILYDMTTKLADMAIWPDSQHGIGAVVTSETRAVTMEGTTSALAPQDRVNIDTGSATTFVSQHSPMRHHLHLPTG